MKRNQIFKNIFLGGIILFLGFTLFSCNNDSNTVNGNLNGLKEFVAPVKQSFTVNSATGGTITSAQGIIITIPANNFQTFTGGAVSGSVSITVEEIFDASIMALNNMSTEANGNLLSSQGVFKITASQSGSELDIINPISIMMPNRFNQSTTNIWEFLSDASTTDPSDSTWIPTNDSIIVIDTIGWSGDTLVDSYFYFTISELNWINCDVLIGASEYGSLCTSNPSGFAWNNTTVFVVIPSINGALSLYNASGSDFCTGSWYSGIPVGYNIAVCGIHYDGTNYEGCIIPSYTVVSGSNNVTMTYTPTTLSSFTSAVLAL